MRLYSARRTNNKTKARAVADNKAIEKLFSANLSTAESLPVVPMNRKRKKDYSHAVEDRSDNLFNIAFEVITKGKWRRIRRDTVVAEN